MRLEHVPAGAAKERAHRATMAACHDLRRRVFVDEQGVDEALEWDGLDERAEHFLARSEPDGAPLGTARMRVVEGDAKAERVAVLPRDRSSGVGRALMEALEDRARALGCPRVLLNAQVRVVAFYRRLGYEASGPVFDSAGIDHRAMSKRLDD